MKTMLLSKYVEIVKPIYVTFKITPHSSCRSYNSASIANIIASVKRRIEKQEKKYVVESKLKVAYMIDIKKDDVAFYFIVPIQYKALLKDKLESTWPKATIEEVADIEPFKAESAFYEVRYKNHDALAITVDKKSNSLLNNALNVVDTMKDGDRVSIVFNFFNANNWGWQAEANRVQDKWCANMETPKAATKASVLGELIYVISQFLDSFFNELLGQKNTNINVFTSLNDALREKVRKLSSESTTKRNDTVINTQIAVISSSKTAQDANNNALITCQSFYSLKGDNEFTFEKKGPCKATVYDADLKITNNRIGVDESSVLLQLPGQDLLTKHKIKHVEVTETNVPEPLQSGVMCLGDSTCKGNTQKAYISTDKSFQYLVYVLIGPTRAGKSTFIANLCYDGSLANEVNIIFDWCGSCKMSYEIKKALKENGKKYLEIDCSDINKLEGVGYNELWCNGNAFEVYRSAKQQATQLITLVDTVQVKSNDDLSAQMGRYFKAACIIVFAQQGPVRDIFETLSSVEMRHKYIASMPAELHERAKKYMDYLLELDNYDKQGNLTGTKMNLVQGILNRVDRLSDNTYLEMMLEKDCGNNLNLFDEIQKSQTIFIKMQDAMFETEAEKDTYATYWLTKIWSALQQREWYVKESKDRLKVNLYFDELYQTPNCQDFLRSKLSQIAKFGAKPFISCHYLGQISIIRNELKSANASYILISGSDKDNYNELKDELKPYTCEDLLKLERHKAICLVRYEGGWSRFTTKLPSRIILPS